METMMTRGFNQKTLFLMLLFRFLGISMILMAFPLARFYGENIESQVSIALLAFSCGAFFGMCQEKLIEDKINLSGYPFLSASGLATLSLVNSYIFPLVTSS